PAVRDLELADDPALGLRRQAAAAGEPEPRVRQHHLEIVGVDVRQGDANQELAVTFEHVDGRLPGRQLADLAEPEKLPVQPIGALHQVAGLAPHEMDRSNGAYRHILLLVRWAYRKCRQRKARAAPSRHGDGKRDFTWAGAEARPAGGRGPGQA